MADKKIITHQVLRQPGMRRILEAMMTVRNEAPALFDEASIAAEELSKSRSERGAAAQ